MALLKNTVIAAALAATTLGASVSLSSSADAQYYHGYRRYHHGIGRGAAIGLGIAGAALAAGAVASTYNRPYYGGYGYGYPAYGYGGYGGYGYGW